MAHIESQNGAMEAAVVQQENHTGAPSCREGLGFRV